MRAVVIGASGGIGHALAAALVARGAEVHALSRQAQSLRGAIAGSIDLTDEDSIASSAARIGIGGNIDLVLCATGLLHDTRTAPEKSLRDLDAQRLATYFAVNSIGPALAAKHFLPLLPRRDRGVFAALSARVGSIGDNRLGGWHGYRASKAALNMLIKTLAIEAARTRPQLLCVGLHPGTVDTRLSQPFQRGLAADTLFTPTVAATRLLDVLEGLAPADSGRCFAWDGKAIEP